MSCATCGNCRHWIPDSLSTDAAKQGMYGLPGFGQCGRIARVDSVAWGEEGTPIVDKAVAVDASDYHAAILSKEDFGCTLHEPRSQS